MEINSSSNKKDISSTDLGELLGECEAKYGQVFMEQIGSEFFVYRPLGRSEYKKIDANKSLSNLQKEDIVCQACTLYPANYDFDNCNAGVPTQLSKYIMHSSYFDATEKDLATLLIYYRSEMWDTDNVLTCEINEAFPQYSLEEIESWGVEKTIKYVSRAEFKLQNFRGNKMNGDIFHVNEYAQEMQQNANKKMSKGTQSPPKVHTEEVGKKNQSGNKKPKLTPEKLRELKAKYPDIPWDNDSIAKDGIGALENVNVDPTPLALRVDK